MHCRQEDGERNETHTHTERTHICYLFWKVSRTTLPQSAYSRTSNWRLPEALIGIGQYLAAGQSENFTFYSAICAVKCEFIDHGKRRKLGIGGCIIIHKSCPSLATDIKFGHVP